MIKSVKRKFIFYSTIFIITTVSLPVIFLLMQMKSNFEERSILLLNSIFDMMSYRMEKVMDEGDRKNISDIVNDFVGDRNIENVRIVNTEGRILYSSQPIETDELIPEFTEELESKRGILERKIAFSKERNTYHALEPIINKVSCQKCHGSNLVLGYLNVETDATNSEVNFYTGIVHIIMFGFVIMGVLIAGSSKLYDVFINRPLNKFLEAIDHVNRGEMNVRIEHRNRDEFGILSHHFNSMMEHLVESQSKIEELNFQKLQRADRLVTLGELTAGIAHEINNNTAIIMARADYLRLASGKDKALAKYREDLDVIIHQLDLLSKIAGEPLKYSKKPSSEFIDVDLAAVINSSIAMLKPVLDKLNIHLYRNYDEGTAYLIRANYVQMQQMFNNLIGNSIDAIGENGKIVVDITNHPDSIEVSVSDDGEGMDENTQKNIFLPFFTTKSEDVGTGLGLYIVKNICDSHDIKISVQSSRNSGTKFYLQFKKIGKM